MVKSVREVSDSSISIPPHIYRLHNALIKEEIITDSRVKKCSKEEITIESDFKQNRRYARRIKRCNLVHSCPICSYIQDRKIYKRVKPFNDILIAGDGTNHLLTFTLRHKRDKKYIPYDDLTKVLYESVKEIKHSRPYRNYYGKENLFYSLTQYEDGASLRNGLHPHCHINIGTTNNASKEEIESRMQPEWVKIVSRKTKDKRMIPSLKIGCVIETGLPNPFYPNRKSLNELTLEEMVKESCKKMKEIFGRKIIEQRQMEQIVMIKKQSTAEGIDFPIDENIFQRIVSFLKRIFSHCTKRWKTSVIPYRTYFQVNKNHHLYKEYELNR